MPDAGPRAIVAGPGATRALHAGGSGRLEVALGVGGYVRLGASGWFLVTGPRASVGPLSLLVAGLGRRRPDAEWEAHVDAEGKLVVGPHRIAIGALASPVSLSPPPRRPGVGCHRAMAAALAVCRPSPAALRPGLAALEQRALAPAVELLAGRGDGLTPAGDDVLAGYAAWTLAAGDAVRLSALAAARSSPIGLAYLRCAERGELPAPATALIAAVRSGDAGAADRHAHALGRWGTSSGAALAWGMAAALGGGADERPHPSSRRALSSKSGNAALASPGSRWDDHGGSGLRRPPTFRRCDMRIDVRLGSGLARLAGAPRLQVDLRAGATVGELLDVVAEQRPVLVAGLPSALTVVSGSQVGGERVLAEGDEVAVLAPVAGG